MSSLASPATAAALRPASALASSARGTTTPTDRIALPDGRVVVVRPVVARDAEAAQTFVRGLSPTSRLQRFHFGLRELPPSLLRAMTDVDHHRHVAIVAESMIEPHGPLWVADARYVRGDDPQEAEFGIAVADAWQGAGLGRELMRRLLRQAAGADVYRLYGDVMHGNRGMLALAARLGGRVEASPEGPGVVRVVFALG